MKYIMKNIKLFALLALIGVVLSACSKMDDTYKDFLEGGEKRYSKKPDSIGINPGFNRAEIWLTVSAPNVSKAMVYWNDRLDSVEIPIVRKDRTDTVKRIINNLQEGAYTFEFVTYDNEGNRSLAVDTVGNVYGEAYQASLNNRLVQRTLQLGSQLKIEWFDESNPDAIGAEVSYKMPNGTERIVQVNPDDKFTDINIRPQSGSLKYRTFFVPHPDAIDTFYTEYIRLIPTVEYIQFPESFEDTKYVKTGYPAAELEIGSGVWLFDNFLIGTAAADRKNGARSARSGNGQSGSTPTNSYLEMKEDLQDGASKFSFYHAICSSDAPSSFKVQASINGGPWKDISEVIQNNSINLTYKEIELDIDDPVRFRFYKLSSAEAGRNEGRMNIDDINILPQTTQE